MVTAEKYQIKEKRLGNLVLRLNSSLRLRPFYQTDSLTRWNKIQCTFR